MPLVFTEEFTTTLGTTPTGWTVVAGGPVVSTGGYRGQCCSFGGALRHALPSSYSAITGFFVSKPNALSGSPFTLQQSFVVGSNTFYQDIVSVGFTTDQEIEVSDGGGHIVCVGNAGFSYRGVEDIWTFIQLDATITSTTIGTSSALKVVANLHLNGESIARGTNAFLTALAASVDTVQLAGSPGATASFIDSIYVYNGIVSAPIVTPNESATRKARVSQAVLEYANLPNAIDARISQAVLEHLDLPDASSVRISQAVIELISVGGGGWIIYEA